MEESPNVTEKVTQFLHMMEKSASVGFSVIGFNCSAQTMSSPIAIRQEALIADDDLDHADLGPALTQPRLGYSSKESAWYRVDRTRTQWGKMQKYCMRELPAQCRLLAFRVHNCCGKRSFDSSTSDDFVTGQTFYHPLWVAILCALLAFQQKARWLAAISTSSG
ncbi:hypothetical protein B0H10DRAFT_1956225 [Mycena sp. CBHHK59/15]|nr:hypothetical protein B0H10DRAFT_1963661 [Mycena sp. CBHHK59/15]KAJ6607432.1 hypothetical protein B0H10DRAFT_1956225 [Mycena sp. CBHHK59/15]